MSKYLVECNCGNKLPVEIGQAGGRIACTCGNLVDVPATAKTAASAARRNRSRASDLHVERSQRRHHRQSCCWPAAGDHQRLELVHPAESARVRPGRLPAQVDRATLKQDDARPNPGTGGSSTTSPWPNEDSRTSNSPTAAQIERIIAERQSLRRTLWIVAAIAAAIAAAAAFWPKSPEVTSRRID